MTPLMQNVLIAIGFVTASGFGVVMLGVLARGIESHLARLADNEKHRPDRY